MQKGHISVHTENIFPIIKKFLYSDHEIFLRELVSNAIDATQKLKTLSGIGEYKGDLGELKIAVNVNKELKTITISDRGIGMNSEEIDKYINQLAFSGAEEFVAKYKNNNTAIIGHFGLGFYSSFMVSDKVEIITRSYRDGDKAAHWTCTGSTEFSIEEADKEERGTTIILHISEESSEFLDTWKISGLLKKYCRFLPVPIEFEGEIINNTSPLWMKKPNELNDDDYKTFYRELYPYSFEEPLFWIHLHVDYPFNLTGILYFPKIKNEPEIQKNKIQLYSNQVFVTEEIKDIVPDFMMLLHGIIDSPDIPLNVSRSALQADGQVKKITGYITKKVADKFDEMMNRDRKEYESKWEAINLFVKYGTISEERFAEKSEAFLLLKNTSSELFSIKEYIAKTEANQKDKSDKIVWLYTNDEEKQFGYISNAKAKDYDVLLLDSPIDNHFISWLEHKYPEIKIVRVDSGHIDKLIDKESQQNHSLSAEQISALEAKIKSVLPDQKWKVESYAGSENDRFILITRGEMERRMSEMQQFAQFGIQGLDFADYNVMINANHPIATGLFQNSNEENKDALLNYSVRLAMLSQGILKGKAMDDFIKDTEQMLKNDILQS